MSLVDSDDDDDDIFTARINRVIGRAAGPIIIIRKFFVGLPLEAREASKYIQWDFRYPILYPKDKMIFLHLVEAMIGYSSRWVYVCVFMAD